MILYIIALIGTVLAVAWLVLLMQVKEDEWIVGATNRVLSNRLKIQELRDKDIQKSEKLETYSGIAYSVMKLFLGGDLEKEIRKLELQNEALQEGDLRSVSVMEMPGYVLQRKHAELGRGGIHRKLVDACTELNGKRYAEKQARQILARILSYPIVGVAAALLLGVLIAGVGAKLPGFAIMLFGSLIVCVLVYAQYDEVLDRVNKRHAAISRQFPNVVSKLALLVTSGMIMDRAWRETADSQSEELYLEMRRTSLELENLVEPAEAYTNFLNRCNTKETTKLASAIIQNQSKGNAEIGRLLKDMAHEAWQERRHTAKRDSEKANSRLMIPTMILFVSILIMIIVPIFLQFGGSGF